MAPSYHTVAVIDCSDFGTCSRAAAARRRRPRSRHHCGRGGELLLIYSRFEHIANPDCSDARSVHQQKWNWLTLRAGSCSDISIVIRGTDVHLCDSRTFLSRFGTDLRISFCIDEKTARAKPASRMRSMLEGY